MKNPTSGRRVGFLRRFYPIPEALFGYLFGILFAALSAGEPMRYAALPLSDALPRALSAELPLLFAAALIALIRPVRVFGGALIFLKAAVYGFGAYVLASEFPTPEYYRYVCVSILLTALYACPLRHAAECFSADRRYDRRTVVNYLLCWLFYSGVALLVLPLRYAGSF